MAYQRIQRSMKVSFITWKHECPTAMRRAVLERQGHCIGENNHCGDAEQLATQRPSETTEGF